MRRLSAFLFAASGIVGALPAAAAEDNVLALQQRLIDVYRENRDAVVRVKAAFEREREDGSKHVKLKVGTGFFISRKGHVLVNASRAAGADRVWIERDDEPYPAKTVGHDRLTNISVLKVREKPEAFAFIPLDSDVETPEVGSIVFAISSPLDFEQTPAFGLITGVENQLGPQVFPTRYIRSTINVEAGEGGCPLLDINGRLVGMTVGAIPEIDASYALPTAALIRVRDDLLFAGEVIHSWMGFEVGRRENAGDGRHVTLTKIVDGSPADKAGLKRGDVLLAIGGREILDVADVPNAVFFTRANQYTTVRVRRDGATREISVKTLPRPEDKPLLEPREGGKRLPRSEDEGEVGRMLDLGAPATEASGERGGETPDAADGADANGAPAE